MLDRNVGPRFKRVHKGSAFSLHHVAIGFSFISYRYTLRGKMQLHSHLRGILEPKPLLA